MEKKIEENKRKQRSRDLANLQAESTIAASAAGGADREAAADAPTTAPPAREPAEGSKKQFFMIFFHPRAIL